MKKQSATSKQKIFVMGLSGVDSAKLFFLFILVLACSYSALVKFSPAAFDFFNWKAPKLVPDVDSICNKYEDKERCKAIVIEATNEANKQCSGYIKKLFACQKSKSSCDTDKKNAESCVFNFVSGKLKDQGLDPSASKLRMVTWQ